MSTTEDDYERALWNNNFYSAPAALIGSASSNHITNLRKSVNLPNSVSTQSLHGHVANTTNDTDGSQPETDGGNVGVSAVSSKNGPRPGFPRASRTSLMKVSPSMKALESVLNGDKGAVSSPAVIAEEDDEEAAEEELEKKAYAQSKSAFVASASSDDARGSTIASSKQEPESIVHGDHVSPQEPPKLNLNYEQPGFRTSALSLQTFHTANSSEAGILEGGLGPAYTPRQNPTDGQIPGRSSSVTTIEYPSYPGTELPKDTGASFAASLPSVETEHADAKPASGHEIGPLSSGTIEKAAPVAVTGTAYPANGNAGSENVESDRILETKKPRDSQPDTAATSSGNASPAPRDGGPKSMVSSSSCPVLFDNHRFAPSTPRDKEKQASDARLVSPEKAGSKIQETIGRSAPPLPEKPQPPQKTHQPIKTSPLKQAPVRSLLDSPFSATPKPKGKPPSLQPETKPKTQETSRQESPNKSSSAFGTPRSKAASVRGSPRKSHSDVGVPQSPSFGGHHRSATTDAGDYHSKPGSDAKANNKRFSFRGLFKIKSKNHSLSKLKDIDEELKHGSRPVKLSTKSKSQSTPNMSALVSEQKEREKKRERERERESQQEREVERKKANERAKADGTTRSTQMAKGNDKGKQKEKKNAEPAPKSEHRTDSKKRFFGLKGSDQRESSKDPGLTQTPPARMRRSTGSRRSFDEEESMKTSKTIQNLVAQEAGQPSTPAMSASVFSAETPSTAYLDSKRNTIREVDDSDYSPELTKQSSSEGQGTEILVSTPAEVPKSTQTDEQSSPHLEIEDISPYISQPYTFNSPLASNSPTQFGSPFKVSFPAERGPPSPHSPRNLRLQPPQSPNRGINKRSSSEYVGGDSNLATGLRYQLPQSPSRSVNSRISSEQLAGETLFPKYLDANEVESIVSLERSRSMRSIKSSNKRSSFLNYDGSDENIILGKNLAVPPQTSMKRSGSILKNSPSLQSVRPDMFHSIETAFANIPSPPPPPPPAKETVVNEEEPVSYYDNDYVDFIEFSDYIDYENLDFASSPLPVSYKEPDSNLPSPSLGIYAQAASGDTDFLLESAEPEPNLKEKPPVLTIDTTPAVDSSTAVDTTTSFEAAENEKGIPKMPQETNVSSPKPEIFHVTSHTDSEFDTSKAASEDPNPNSSSIDPTPSASPLNNTFKFATENAQRGDKSSTTPRPVSMSFKGFSGSAFKDRILPYSGSHQSINFEENFENSSVGQGFGSSDEDSDDGSISYEGDEDYTKFHTVAESRQPEKGPKPTNSFERRQQHIKSVLDLQPPSQNLPFHHNRIPSISDHSSISSPKSLTSFISRMRKSPMSSPKLSPQKHTVKFSSRIILYDTYHHDEYDRHPEIATCNQLTPLLAQQIKEELNELKANMEVHVDSECYTQFF